MIYQRRHVRCDILRRRRLQAAKVANICQLYCALAIKSALVILDTIYYFWKCIPTVVSTLNLVKF